MSKEMSNTVPVVSGPITKELAEARRSAVAALLTALKARITARNIVFMAGSNMPVENLGGEVDIADYARETDLYRVSDDVEYLAADLMPVDDLDAFMPVCVIKRRGRDTKGGSYILATTVYHMQNHGGCKSLGLPVRIMVVHEAILGEVDSRLKTTVFAAFNADRSIIILVLEVYE